MKKVVIFIISFILCVNAWGQGIEFTKGKLSEINKKAEKENKLVFVDCYTKWCGPCKNMANNIFPTKEVGDYMNKHFVCIKSDGEVGEGKDILKNYKVQCFPTFLILNTKGEELHRFTGQSDAVTFLKRVAVVYDEKNRTSTFHNKYNSGDYDYTFLQEYIQKLLDTSNYKKARLVLAEYHKLCPNEKRINDITWKYYRNKYLNEIDSPTFKFLIYNKDEIIKSIPREELEKTINDMYGYQLVSYLNWYKFKKYGYSGKVFLDFKKDIKAAHLKKKNDLLDLVDLVMCCGKYSLDKYLKKFPSLTKNLNSRHKCYAITIFMKYKKTVNKEQKAKIREIAEKFEKEISDYQVRNSLKYFLERYI